MGYFVKGKEIAKLNPKARVVSLSASPNFVQFESKDVDCNSEPTPAIRPSGSYVRSTLSIDVDKIRNHMTSIDRGEETNATLGIARVYFRERMTGQNFELLIRFEGYEPNTNIEIRKGDYPHQVILSRDSQM